MVIPIGLPGMGKDHYLQNTFRQSVASNSQLSLEVVSHEATSKQHTDRWL